MAKVILVDNYDREGIPDQLYLSNLSMEDARAKAKEYNDSYDDDYPWFARAVEDNHRLWRGIEELV